MFHFGCDALLQVQSSIGHSDYVRRDQALKGLIQPLAGEYGMHNGLPQGVVYLRLSRLFTRLIKICMAIQYYQ